MRKAISEIRECVLADILFSLSSLLIILYTLFHDLSFSNLTKIKITATY